MHKALFLAAAILGTMAGALRSAESDANLLLNASFEDGKPDPWEWFLGAEAKATGSQDTSEKHGGESSYHVRNESPSEPNVFGALRQVVKNAKPGATYLITAWVKGSGVSLGNLACGEKWEKRASLPKGDYDWTEVRLEYTTGPNETEFPVVFIVDGIVTDLWIDDVSVAELGGDKGASIIFPPSTWPDIPAALRFYPVLPESSGPLPKVVIQTPDSTLRADVSLSRTSAFFFTTRRS
jgi:hypothetical protein